MGGKPELRKKVMPAVVVRQRKPEAGGRRWLRLLRGQCWRDRERQGRDEGLGHQRPRRQGVRRPVAPHCERRRHRALSTDATYCCWMPPILVESQAYTENCNK